MKKVFSFVAASLAVLSLSFTSCTEDPAKPLSVDMSAGKTATISGTLLVNPDKTKDADKQTFEGKSATIIVTVPYSEILDDSSAKGNWITTVTSDSRGIFSVEVPTNPKGVTVSFTVSDIRGEQKQKVGADDKTLSGVWKFSVTDEGGVKPGKIIVKEHTEGKFTALKEDGSKI